MCHKAPVKGPYGPPKAETRAPSRCLRDVESTVGSANREDGP